MKLAEALILRSERKKRYDHLRARAQATARYQEGDQPPEDAGALVVEAGEVLSEFQELIRRINRTNSNAEISPGITITDAIAERDVLKLQHALLTGVADAASGSREPARQMRSELRYVPAVSVAELRSQADDVARRLREIDTKIQEANWTLELLE